MADDAPDRILRLAAYLADRRGTPVSLGTITADVPGYRTEAARDERGELLRDTREWETVRKRLQRVLRRLREMMDDGPTG